MCFICIIGGLPGIGWIKISLKHIQFLGYAIYYYDWHGNHLELLIGKGNTKLKLPGGRKIGLHFCILCSRSNILWIKNVTLTIYSQNLYKLLPLFYKLFRIFDFLRPKKDIFWKKWRQKIWILRGFQRK